MNKPGNMDATWQSLTTTLSKGTAWTRSWTSLVVTVVAVLLTLRVLLHVLLALFVPQLRIRTVSALGLGGFEWHDASGVVITVERFAWSIVGTNTSKKGWFILRLVGVEVRMPKRIVIEPPPPRTPRNTSGTPRREAPFEHPRDGPCSTQHPLNLNGSPVRRDSVFDPSYSPPQTPRMDEDSDDVQQRSARRARKPSLSRLALRLVRRMLALVLATAHLIVRRLTSLLALFAIEIDLAVELEDVARVKCLVDVGGEIARPFVVRRTVDKHRRSNRHDIDRELHIGVWIAISGLKIHGALPPKSTIPQAPTPLPAVEIQSLLLLSASTPFGPTGGLIPLIKCRGKQWNAGRATVRVSLTIEKPRRARQDLDTGVHIRVYEGKALLAKVEDLLHERKQFLRRHPRPDRAVVGAAEELSKAPNSAKPKPTPLFFLRSFDADIPLVVVSAHYHTPHHTLATSPRRQLPQAVAFALTIRKISARLRMSGSTDMVKREHAEWLGKDRVLGLGGTIGWDEIEGRVKVDGSAGECNDKLVSDRQRSDPMMSCAEDILPNSAKAFSIGRSSVTTTTTWLPPRLFESFAAHTPELVTYTSPRYFNDETVIIEGYIGEVRGHAKYETIDSALRIFMARPRSQYGKYTRTDLSSTSEAKLVRGAPRVVGHIAMAGIELRVQAPTSSSEDNIADERDQFFREWACPDLFCLSIPNGTFSFGGEYEDRSLRRTEADRRLARRNEKYRSKRPGEPHDREASYKSVELGDKGMLTESNIPIKQHYADGPESTVSDVHDLRSLPMKYTARAHVAAETLNIYIIATDPVRGEEGTGSSECFLDQQSMLPSNTRRLDILAAGPVEITLTQQIKCSVKDDAQLGAIAEFNLHTLVGEHNIMVEHVGIDLWRPIVMSCLRDFLSSSASASATKTTRGKPTDESGLPEPKPLVVSLPHNQCIYAAIGTCDVRLAGSDPKNDEQACRGIAVHCGPVVFEYLLQPKLRQEGAVNYGNRASLELAEDIRQEANALAMSHREQALVKVAVHDWSVDPVVDARETLGHTRKYSMWPGMEQDGHEDASWELRNRAHITDLTKRRKTIMVHRPDKTVKRIAHVPILALRARIVEIKERTPNGPLDEVIVSVKGRTGTLRLELFSIYLCLVAFSALRSLSPKHNLKLSPRPPAVAPDVDEDVGADEVEHAEGESSKADSAKRPKPLISLRGDVDDLNLFITLPHNVPLYLNLKRPCVQHTKQICLLVEWDTGLLAGDSPTVLGKWDDLLRLRVTSLAVRPEPGNDGHRPFVISLSSETARMRIPFRYVYSRIIDNVANLVKATKQLVHQHVEGGMNSVLEPEVEAAKKLPRIELNIKMFAIEIQDDPFETRLNIIWRAGYEEQSARIERHLAFQAKLEAIRKAHEESGMPLKDDIDIDGCAQETPMARHGPNGHHTVSPKQALHDLLAYNSSHWVKRMRNAVAEQARREEALTRRLYGGKHNSKRPDSMLPVPLLPTSKSVPLARATLHNLQFTISRTSFAEEKLPDFLHDVGKGLPRDTQFTLLVPMHVNVQMSEATIRLRDYPLPLLHIPIAPVAPDVAKTQTPKASWIMDMDLVIGEEIGSEESIRRVPVVIVPAHAAKSSTNLYSIVVPRTAMTTKAYAVPTIRVRSPYATRIGWGNSISPAIQDVAKVLDTITKQSPDPSDRIGFWDKIRLQFHWRVSVLFEGEGPVHFHLKGSRDPYSITGFGAGFVKSWHGSVKFLVGHQNPDREFFQILSDRYILGVPNLRDYVDNAATGLAQTNRDNAEYTDNNTTLNGLETGQYKFGADTEFVKVCARLVHGVRWGMGCVVERACTDKTCDKVECKGRTPFHRACRIWDFIPHWEVHTKTDRAIKPDGEVEDSFAGFRSDFIHFSISLTSPSTLDLPSCGTSPNPDDASSDHEAESFVEDVDKSNSLHFTPHAMAHFARWWKLFDGTMSLPIRQGKLFPSSQAPSKKFGKHCATIKYRFSLAPLFVSHTYRQDALEEWAKGETTALGIKAKIGRFNVDLHQREQESLVTHSDTMVTKQVIHKAFYLAEVDLDDVDLRAISATFSEPEKAQLAPLEEMNEGEQELPPLPLPNISDEDLAWVDRDDYVDISYSFEDVAPRVRMFPFITCPRLTYDRQVDVARWTPEEAEQEQRRHDQEGHRSGAGDHARSQTLESTHDERSEQAYPKSKFGREPSHTCLVGQAKSAIDIQIDAANARLEELQSQQKTPAVAHTRRELESRIAAITAIIARLKKVRETEVSAKRSPTLFNDDSSSTHPHEPAEDEGEELSHITSHFYSQWGDWENRYMFHNPSMHLTNASRQILLKYYHSSQDRKAFVYHLSATAIKFIRDLAAPAEDPKSKKSTVRQKGAKDTNDLTVRGASSSDVSASARRLLDDLLKSHVEEGKTPSSSRANSWAEGEDQGSQARQHQDDDHGDMELDPDAAALLLPERYTSKRAHFCMFIKPQIALTSDVDDKSTVILTAFRAQFKSFAVNDSEYPDDPINADVLHSTFATLEGLQAFCPQVSTRTKTLIKLTVPLETLIDLRVEPWGFDRIVPRTWASMRYDKFNKLRLGSSKAVHEQEAPHLWAPSMSHFRTDRIALKNDKLSVSANPTHFTAVYNVVTDLLLYSDPAHKRRNSKLEALVFTHDFTHLDGAIGVVSDLQYKVRSLAAMVLQYRIHLDELDGKGRLEMFTYMTEAIRQASELTLLVESISRARSLSGAFKPATSHAGLLFEAKAPELTWHMHDNADIPFAKFSVTGAEFAWTSKSDSSVSNRLVIKDLKALNSSPEHLFAEIIAKYHGDRDNKMAKVDVFAAVLWNALPPVGGISIVEQFELHLHPIRLQLEHHVGRRIMDYVFSQRRKSDEDGGDSRDHSEAESDADSISSGSQKQAQRSLKTKLSNNSLTPPSIAVHSNHSVDSLQLRRQNELALNGSVSQLMSSSASSIHTGQRQLRHVSSMDVLSLATSEQVLDAEEMRARARLNRTFVLVDISPTTLCLTYKASSEKSDHSRMFDLFDIVYKTPSMQYRSKTWSFLDLITVMRKDTMKSIWSQRSSLLGQYLSRAHRKLPLTEQRSAMSQGLKSKIKLPFRHKITAPSNHGTPVTRSPTSPLGRVRTPSPNPQSYNGDYAAEDAEAAAEAVAEAQEVRGRGQQPEAIVNELERAEATAALVPFPQAQQHHILSDDRIMAELEPMVPIPGSPGSPSSLSARSSNLGRVRQSTHPMSEGRSSSHHSDSSSSSYPTHQPLRASISGISDQEKAHLLLGSSFD